MKEYIVINIPGLDELVITVNNAIKDGWQPIGGICVIQEIQEAPVVRVYAQAMVR